MKHAVRNIAILGSTGSIGRSVLQVISRFPDRFRVIGLSAHRNIDLLRKQIDHFHPHAVALQDNANASALRKAMPDAIQVLTGEDGLCELVSRADVDLVVSSLVGFAGLKPTYRAIEAGKDIALANKETLVVGGELIMGQARARGVHLLPVDSEHSAILQCLQGEDIRDVERLILTASGGPFLDATEHDLATATSERALRHPTWNMGKKITIDSATLMNKGLEVIEAFWLFGIPAERISVLIHPQSIIHSMVAFADGSVKAQLGVPDMKIPIQYALLYPERPFAPHPRVDFAALKQMTFFSPDLERFPCLGLAFRALKSGGTAPTVLNAANEVAVELFLANRIPFPAIASTIREALDVHTPLEHASLEELIRIDKETRETILRDFPVTA